MIWPEDRGSQPATESLVLSPTRSDVAGIVWRPPGGLIFIWSTVFTLHCYNTNYVTTSFITWLGSGLGVSTDSQVGQTTPLTRYPQISNLMNGKKIVSFHSAGSYKTFKLTFRLPGEKVGGRDGLGTCLFVCLCWKQLLIMVIVSLGHTEDLLTDQATGGRGGWSAI